LPFRPGRLSTISLLVVALALIAAGVYLVLNAQPPRDLSLERVRKAGVLLVGLDPSYPPFEVVDGQGNLAGYDVDLTRELTRRMGVRPQPVAIDFGGIFDALQVGRIDVIIGGVSPDPDSQPLVRYTSAYFDDGLVTIVNRDAPGSTYGIESGSDADIQLDRLAPLLPGATFQHFDDQDQIHDAAIAEKLHGAIVDAVTARVWAAQSPKLTVGTMMLSSTPFVIAGRSSDKALLDEVDRVLRSMVADGFVAKLDVTWLK
jgi:polar amino acid transport system substrate-binding protein